MVEEVQDGENLALADSLDTLSEVVEAREHHVDELIRCLSVLQTAVHAVVVHCLHKVLEFSLVKKVVAIGITCSESIVDLHHEGLKGSNVSLELLFESGASSLFFGAERVLPGTLVGAKGGEESMNSLVF